MKHIFFKYPKLLISLSLVVSALLQFVWLRQLFVNQKENLEQEISIMVSRTAQEVRYDAITSLANPGNLAQLKQLYLSPEWEQLTRAFENMKGAGIRGTASVDASPDSTIVVMELRLTNRSAGSRSIPYASKTGMTEAELALNDSLSLAAMKQKVIEGLNRAGVHTGIWYRIYETVSDQVVDSTIPGPVQPGYAGNRHSYNIQNLYSYQLCLNNIDIPTLYRMRCYLLSCLLMLTLTAIAFYVIFTSLKKQQLYADAKADFTRNMTHEFKTPIATASVALESITKYNLTADPVKLFHYIDISRHELSRLDTMVEKVLSIAKENDKVLFNEFQLIDVQPLITQVADSMQVQLKERSGNITVNLSSEPCFVYGDPLLLSNILYTLIDNSIRYNSSTPLIVIGCTYEKKGIMITVKDNGPGIPGIYQKKVFEKYFRIPMKDNVYEVRGSGLGLYYVKQVLEQHNGSIELQSSKQEGSTFVITIPHAE